MMNPSQQLKEWYDNQNVRALAKFLFPVSRVAQDMTPTQEKIIKDVVYKRVRLLDVAAYTQYGKTETFALAFNISILFEPEMKIAIIASAWDKSEPIRNYIVEQIYSCPFLLNLVHFEKGGSDRMKKEANKKRITFKHGSEYRFYSAQGNAQRLMSHGLTKDTGRVHIEEAAEIQQSAFAKIWRFITGKLENSMLSQTYNPWSRDTVAYKNYVDPKFKHYKVNYKDGIKEGRITAEDVELMREKLTPLEFQVLYDCEFPEESENQLISLTYIKEAHEKTFGIKFKKELDFIEKILRNKDNYTKEQVKSAEKLAKQYTKIISCDPADKGRDRTIIFWGIEKLNKYGIIGHFQEAKTESRILRKRLQNMIVEFIGNIIQGKVNVDAVGIGTGPTSELKGFVLNEGYKNVKIIACKNGEAAIDKDFYARKKEENYFRLREMFIKGQIAIPKIKELVDELVTIKWRLSPSGKREIFRGEIKDGKLTKKLDGESPDWADALMYFTWKDKKQLAFVLM